MTKKNMRPPHEDIERVAGKEELALCRLAAVLDEFHRFENLDAGGGEDANGRSVVLEPIEMHLFSFSFFLVKRYFNFW